MVSHASGVMLAQLTVMVGCSAKAEFANATSMAMTRRSFFILCPPEHLAPLCQVYVKELTFYHSREKGKDITHLLITTGGSELDTHKQPLLYIKLAIS